MDKPTYEELEAEVITLRPLVALVAQLQARIEELEAQLKKNSKNSSKPPSSDRKPNQPRSDDRAEKRRPYHMGARRQLLPESEVTSREVRVIEQCPRCRSQMGPTGEVTRWQQIDIPPIQASVHQIELHECRCPRCGLVDRPQLQEGESCLLAPRLEALVNLAMGQFRQGHRMVRQFIELLVPKLSLSQGLISKVKARASVALDKAHNELREAILSSEKAVHLDPTGWRHRGMNQHIVVVRSGNLVSYSMVPNQNAETLNGCLGDKKVNHGVTDRASPMPRLSFRTHQYCLAHLLRNIQGLAERRVITPDDAQALGLIHEALQSLFHDKHQLDRGEISESTWRQRGYVKWQAMKDDVEILERLTPSKKVRSFCKRLLKEWKHFRVYLRSRDHPMTNNPAEEALRNLVIARKLCFGSQSDYGRWWREAMHSCIETLRRQGRSVLDFLTEAIRAVRAGQQSPKIAVA